MEALYRPEGLFSFPYEEILSEIFSPTNHRKYEKIKTKNSEKIKIII